MNKCPKITAIVPAYNEEKTIGNVLKTLKRTELIDEIIVINDGSVDNTYEVAESYGVKIINFKHNQGKSRAVKKVCSKINTDIIFFCDADLVGLKSSFVEQIISPVIDEEAVMSIGLRDKGIRVQNYLQYRFPKISGERAILYETFKEILNSSFFSYEWGMETAMNEYCRRYRLRVKAKVLHYNHTHMPRKMGMMKGIKGILKQASELCYILFQIRFLKKT